MDMQVNNKKLKIRVVFLIFLIFFINYLAQNFYWYYSIASFDMFMHFLGGFWIGLALFYFLDIRDFNLKIFLKILFGVLLIGIFWEIFEIFVNNLYFAKYPFDIIDTIEDVFFDLLGGLCAIWYFQKRIKKNLN